MVNLLASGILSNVAQVIASQFSSKSLIYKEKKIYIISIRQTYIVCPFCQRSAPNNNEDAAVIVNLPRLYCGFLQQERCCFQRQALNCSHSFCAKRVEKCSFFAPSAGQLSSLTSSSFFLNRARNVGFGSIRIFNNIEC